MGTMLATKKVILLTRIYGYTLARSNKTYCRMSGLGSVYW